MIRSDYAPCSAPAVEVLEVLREARAHIAGGYSPHLCRTSSGAICAADDEGVSLFDVPGALEVAARGRVDALIVAGDLLCRMAAPGFGVSLEAWLVDRKLSEVLSLFDRAILRAQAVARRKT